MRPHLANIATASLFSTFHSFAIGRSLSVVNNCKQTLWPAVHTSAGGSVAPSGWQAASGHEQVLEVAENWNGRIWARTGCNFESGGACLTGDSGALESGGTGVPPATLAEFLFNGAHGQDFYDVSNVDGFNVEISITHSKDCPQPSCSVDINASCPPELQVTGDNGEVAGCMTACSAGQAPQDRNCCSGSFNNPDTCTKDGILYYDVFKTACPDAYAFAYDEASESSLWTCPSSKAATYTVTFCPSSGTSNGTEASQEDEDYVDKNEGYGDDEEYDQDEGYGQDEEYGQDNGNREDEGYREDDEYGQDEGFGEDEDYGQDNGNREDEGYREDDEYSQDEGYGADEYYGQDDGNREDEGYREDEDYDQDHGNHKHEGYREDDDYGEDEGYRKDDGYGEDEGYGEGDNDDGALWTNAAKVVQTTDATATEGSSTPIVPAGDPTQTVREDFGRDVPEDLPGSAPEVTAGRCKRQRRSRIRRALRM